MNILASYFYPWVKFFFKFAYMTGLMVLLILSRGVAKAEFYNAQPKLGINLAGPSDWNTELPFVDVFRMSRPWGSQRQGAKLGKGPELSLDAHGWVVKLEPGCSAETLLCSIKGGHYPSGEYTILYEGIGRIEFRRAAKIISQTAGRIVINVDAKQGGFSLKIMETDPDNYVRNIRVIMPGYEKTYRDNPFHPLFLKRWQGIACIRFMDWMKTNGSEISKWSDCPIPETATFSGKGVALEWMIDLCNRLSADPWFCMPHKADDNYIRNFAQMVKDRLDPKLKVYIEYSNEVWNDQFDQHTYAVDQGVKLGFSDKNTEAAWRFTAYRSVQIFTLWEEIFGGKQRLVRLLPSQAANPIASNEIVEFQNAWKHADALAIAPYVGCSVKYQKEPTERQVEAWTVDQALDYMEKIALEKSGKQIRKRKQTAHQYGLKLIAYEGGQHMTGRRGGHKNEKIEKLFFAANNHDRMGTIYRNYFDLWAKEGGDLFCHFSSLSRWSRFGCWGLMQYYDDDPVNSPKFMATMQWAKKCGQQVNYPEAEK